MEFGAACRALGLSHFVAGDFRSAQTTLEQAMRLHSPTHDDDFAACSVSIPWQARWLTSRASTSFAASFRQGAS